jgi:hypothetical protein
MWQWLVLRPYRSLNVNYHPWAEISTLKPGNEAASILNLLCLLTPDCFWLFLQVPGLI